jgi:gliding motility-associated-like protein
MKSILRIGVLFYLFFNQLPTLLGQTLIMNEVSQGTTGNMEYVEFVVVDTTVSYNCLSGTPPTIDIRGWIFDDNSGYHGAGGVAGGCIRFAFHPTWAAVPLGTIILLYNDASPDPSIPATDLSLADGDCRIVAPISDPNLFESNTTTPGAIACSYPATGWTPGGNWSNVLLANTGDCARLVDLSGCEVFSVCYASCNVNTLIYFQNGAELANDHRNSVYFFNDGDPNVQGNWSIGCTDNEIVLDANQCGANLQTPGQPNNAANAAFISQFNNGCSPITPVSGLALVDNDEICSCDGQASASGSGSIGPYTYEWFDSSMNPIGQTTATATGLCAGDYFVTITSSIGCDITEQIAIAPASGLSIISILPTNPQCAGDCNGEITVVVSGGTLPYSYQWYDAGMNPIGTDAATITGLCSGDYSVEVTDASGGTTTFFTEDFGTGCTQGNLANGTATLNGAWTTTLTGFNGAGANNWFVSATEAGMGAGNCGDGCLGTGPDNRTLHVANVANGTGACFFCPTGDCGAAYADGTTDFGFCVGSANPTMNARAESPTIDCSGQSNLTLSFEYIFGGQPGVDFCTVEYFDGAIWSTLTIPAQTPTCGGGQGLWTALSIALPPSADNNPNVRIGFRWQQIVDDLGTDPSFAVDNIELSSLAAGCPATASVTLTDPIPPIVVASNTSPVCSNSLFSLAETGGDAVSWSWSSDGSAVITNTTDNSPSISGAVNGEVFTVVGTDMNGCQGTAQTIVSINPISTGTDVQVACGSYTWIDGVNYTSSTNTPTFTIVGGAANGCDSIVTLNLTINTFVTGTDVQVACGSYTWIDGVNYTSSTNTPTFTIIGGAVNGCDSIVTLNLTINTFVTGTDVQVACGSYTWIDGLNYTSSTNTPTFTIIGGAANGCDSIVTLNLTINTFVTGTDVQVACGSYTWIDGLNYTSSTNIPTFTLVGGAVNGCDSIVTLNLTINTFVTGTDVQVACGSYTWIDGVNYTSSTNTPTFTIVGGAANGCDSIVTLNLTINTFVTGTDVQVACGSYTWIDGVNYTSSTNTPTFTIVGGAVNGCDSIVTLNLTINTFVTGTDVQVACGSYTWIDGLNYTSSTNTPTFTIIGGAVNGCDSIVTLNLTINTFVTGTDVQVACGSYTWIDGLNYTSSTNTPTFTIVGGAANGCDSIVTLNLTINTFVAGTDVQVACGSYTWIDGLNYTSSTNTPTFTIVGGSANGCDSIVTLNLTINTFVTGTDVQVACGSYTWIDGVNYTSSTNAPTFTLVGGAVNGCDSIVTLNLTINTFVTGTDVQIACGSYTWIDGLNYTSSTNTPTFTLVGGAANGCDSIVTLNLSINTFVTGTDVQVACGSYTWIDGLNYTSSTNTPTFTIIGGAVNGCDSVVTLNLSINTFVTGTDVQIACGSYTWIDGLNYTSSTNTPTFTIIGGAVNGCDSIVTLNLTINTFVTGTDVQVACGSYTWIDGVNYTSSTNTPTFTIVGGAANGCDSIVTLNLSMNTFVTGTDVQVACGSYTWIDGVNYTSSTNTPTFMINGGAVNGCDSLVTLNLTINTFPVMPLLPEDTSYCINATPEEIVASGSGGTFLWSTDSNFITLIGSSNSILPFQTLGSNTYYVIESLNGCPSPVNSITITIVNCDITVPTAFTPDGDGVNDDWQILDLDFVYPNNSVLIYNRWGNLIYEHESLKDGLYDDNRWNGKYNDQDMPVGSYYYIILFNDENGGSVTGVVSILRTE